ncbi:MAG TPA: GTP-binding protein [Alphaproteobacteria bacterium]|jgi:G3E family GTPase|nr:GTP-binding protein [Alphaproteobacteria bacterium]
MPALSLHRERPIPFTVIGGFLGAGKTTLLNRLLREADGIRYAVLVNDFGSLNIDAELIAAHDGETIALANGCICCSIGDSLLDTLLSVLSRADPADHILVEASGVADPARIAEIAVLDPALQPDGVLVLADAAEIGALADDPRVGDTVRRQLAAADLIVLNKADLVEAEVLASREAWLAEGWPQAARLTARQAEVPAALLLGRGGVTPPAGGHPARRHDHGHDLGHAHEDGFRRAMLSHSAPLDRQAFARFADALPPAVLRAKGFVRLAGTPDAAMLFQKAGRRWSLVPAARGERPAETRLVFIGTPEMPGEDELRRRLDLVG